MKRSLLPLVLLVPALVAVRAVPAGVGFHPEAESSLAKLFGLELELEVDDLSATFNGEDISENVDLGDDLGLLASFSVAVTDSYAKIGNGRTLDLERSFDEFTVEYESGDDSDSSSADDIEGAVVRFVWNEEDDDYEVSFADDSEQSDESLLESLSEDMDLRALLPPEGDVEEDDSWEVDGSHVSGLLFPGFDLAAGLSMAAEVEEEAAELLTTIAEQLADGLEDVSYSCEYVGSREVDDTEVGVIEVTLEGSITIDLSIVLAEMGAAQLGAEASFERADLQIELEGTGELQWDLERGHLHTFELESDLGLAFEVSVTADMGMPAELEGQVGLSGSLAWRAELAE